MGARLVRFMLGLSCALAVAACADEPEPALVPPGGGGDSGGAGTGGGGTGVMEPPLRGYVPPKMETCQPASASAGAAAQASLGTLSTATETWRVSAMDLCGADPAFGCAPCSGGNPMLDLLAAADQVIDRAGVATSLREYVRSSLGAQPRSLTFSVVGGQLVVAEAEPTECAGGTGSCVQVGVDALGADCSSFRNAAPAQVMSAGMGMHVQATATVPFQVGLPLLSVLPDPRLPAVEQQVFIARRQRMQITGESPTFDIQTTAATGQGCGSVVGWVSADAAVAALGNLVMVDPFLDPEKPGFIKTVLAARLEKVRVQ